MSSPIPYDYAKDPTFNPVGYHLFKNFLTKEEAKIMADYIDANSEPDPKPNFRWMTIRGSEEDILESKLEVLSWDPNDKIKEMLRFSRKYIEENFNLMGELHLRRVHGNIMDEGSKFYYHTDEDPVRGGQYEEVKSKRTYVADLFVNDDYEGGLFGFDTALSPDGEPNPESREWIKPEAGDLIIFGGYNTWHGIEPIEKGSRINIMGIYFDVHPEADMDAIFNSNTREG